MLQFQFIPIGLSVEHGKVFRTAMYLIYDQTRKHGLKIEGHAKGGLFVLETGKLKAEKDSGMSRLMQQVLSLSLCSSAGCVLTDTSRQKNWSKNRVKFCVMRD